MEGDTSIDPRDPAKLVALIIQELRHLGGGTYIANKRGSTVERYDSTLSLARELNNSLQPSGTPPTMLTLRTIICAIEYTVVVAADNPLGNHMPKK